MLYAITQTNKINVCHAYIYTRSSTEDLELIIFLIDGDNSTYTKERTCPLRRTNRSVQMKLKFILLRIGCFLFCFNIEPHILFFSFEVSNDTNYLKLMSIKICHIVGRYLIHPEFYQELTRSTNKIYVA